MRYLISLSALAVIACSPSQQVTDPVEESTTHALAETLNCIRNNDYSVLAAHRAGPAPGYAENALSTIAYSAERGALFAEIDVAKTSDGVFFLIHDDTLDRTTTGTGEWQDQSWDQINTFRLVDQNGMELDETMPTLDDALRVSRETGILLNIDLKGITPTEIVEEVQRHNAISRVSFIAYTVDQAAEYHDANPDVFLSVPDRLEEISAAGIPSENYYVWLGVNRINADRDAELERQDIEASAGLFRFNHSEDAFRNAKSAGLEILSIDDVTLASTALGGSAVLQSEANTCAAWRHDAAH